ncbi:myelin expression factor 2-like isoform X2 [Anguilla anguilla]|uniref:myelin expression factor 2-like isoform X2 n=1 Tax=Anguilla anguilla TaxID=7936 RepID=UPI0015B3105D|nr:myelin expression factor 2-like isoform X2 [Anguilla anguilla]
MHGFLLVASLSFSLYAHLSKNTRFPHSVRLTLPRFSGSIHSLSPASVGQAESWLQHAIPSDSDEAPTEKLELKEKTSGGNKKSNRFQPYSKDKHAADKKSNHRNRVFISNIPYDMKWQAIKDLMREKVGEVTYVELFKDAEGKSRGCGVVEFKDEEFVKKAMEVMNKHDLNGRPLNIKEDPDGEHARRILQRSGGMFPGGRGQDGGPGVMSLPPSIANNPNIPPEIISSLQAGRLGTTVFVANLDFKVGWRKLKEVFSMAGTVKRADIKADKDGKSRGMGTVTFDQALEAVQAISMFNGQMLFDRPMHVKMDDKSIPPDDFRPVEKAPQLPRGLGGIGMGLGPGGQPINANRMSGGGAMGNMGPGGMDGPGFGGMGRMGGMGGGGGYGGMDGMGNMGGFGGRDMAPMGRMGGMDDFRGNPGAGMGGMGLGAGMGGNVGDMYRSGMADFGRNDMTMGRGFGDSFGGMGGGMGNMGMSSGFDRMGGAMDMNRGFGGFGGTPGPMGGGMSDRGSAVKGGCQIFVRNLSYDLTWQKLKEKFSHCGQVMFAEIKMENGKSKGCGTVRFDSPESAEQACRLMNGTKINGREVDVRIDRNA